MKPWSRRTSVLAGIALITLSNAVALGGVAWNRSGEPESRLKLSKRELRVTSGDFNRESNGVMLSLVWRTRVSDSELSVWHGLGGGTPPWLDEAKMRELGFTVPDAESDEDLSRRHGTSREVLLVLELDGPAWRAQLDQVRAKTDELIAKAATQPGEQAERSIDEARQWLQREENEFSRLFVVDAGLDLDALRLRYPDRARYAIVPGRVVPARGRGGNTNPRLGYLQGLATSNLNMPYAFRNPLTGADNGRSARDKARDGLKATDVSVAFGRRLEPWIIAVDTAGIL